MGKLTKLIEESYREIKEIEESSRFWREFETWPLDKQVDVLRRLWLSNFDKGDWRKSDYPSAEFLGSTPKEKLIGKANENLIGKLNTHYLYGSDYIKNQKRFVDELKKDFRFSDNHETQKMMKRLNTPLIQNSDRQSDLKTYKNMKEIKQQNQTLNPDNELYFAHAGSYNYIKNFFNGKAYGYGSVGLDKKAFGLQMTRKNEPLENSMFSQHSVNALSFGDIPGVVTGKAKGSLFNEPNNVYNGSMMSKPDLSKISDLEIKKVEPKDISLGNEASYIRDATERQAWKYVDAEKYKKLPANKKFSLAPGVDSINKFPGL